MDQNNPIHAAEKRASALGLKVADLCVKVGVNRSTWQRWKAGKHRPRWDDVQRIEMVLSEHAQSQRGAA